MYGEQRRDRALACLARAQERELRHVGPEHVSLPRVRRDAGAHGEAHRVEGERQAGSDRAGADGGGACAQTHADVRHHSRHCGRALTPDRRGTTFGARAVLPASRRR
jgi:hypothetical protein